MINLLDLLSPQINEIWKRSLSTHQLFKLQYNTCLYAHNWLTQWFCPWQTDLILKFSKDFAIIRHCKIILFRIQLLSENGLLSLSSKLLMSTGNERDGCTCVCLVGKSMVTSHILLHTSCQNAYIAYREAMEKTEFH